MKARKRLAHLREFSYKGVMVRVSFDPQSNALVYREHRARKTSVKSVAEVYHEIVSQPELPFDKCQPTTAARKS